MPGLFDAVIQNGGDPVSAGTGPSCRHGWEPYDAASGATSGTG
jgi:hypothetical protein